MKEKPKVLGVILARGGSKSIPKKNIYPCAGKPLIAYTVEAAKKAKNIDRLIISTDDDEIIEVAKNLGVEVPFTRPAILASDDTSDIPVLIHAVEEMKKLGFEADIVVQLRPTTPLKSGNDIDKGIELILLSDADSVRSVCPPPHTPFKMHKIKESGELEPILLKDFPEVFDEYPETFNISRHLLPKVWRHSGYLDIMTVKSLHEDHKSRKRKHIPLIIESWRDVDIDSLHELKIAEMIIEDYKNKNIDINE